jgi:hypothetical protein
MGMRAPAKARTVRGSSVTPSGSNSNSGCVNCHVPLNRVTWPANSPCRPTVSCFSRHRWLKKVRDIRDVPSLITASRIVPRRFRIGRTVTETTSAMTVTCSSGPRVDRSVSSPRSAYLRG